jgi:hypothetical protein
VPEAPFTGCPSSPLRPTLDALDKARAALASARRMPTGKPCDGCHGRRAAAITHAKGAADLRDPVAVLGHPGVRAVIDPAEPVCVILAAVLHFLDAGTARKVTAGYARLIAPGSCLIISCATYDDEALAKRLAAEYTAGPFVSHSREDVKSFFAGLELVGPGVTEAQTWRPWQPEPVLRRRDGHVLAGVGCVIAPDVRGTGRESPVTE